MKEKQFLFATQIYLFLALGKDSLILIYGCFMSLLKRIPTFISHQNKAVQDRYFKCSNNMLQPPLPLESLLWIFINKCCLDPHFNLRTLYSPPNIRPRISSPVKRGIQYIKYICIMEAQSDLVVEKSHLCFSLYVHLYTTQTPEGEKGNYLVSDWPLEPPLILQWSEVIC